MHGKCDAKSTRWRASPNSNSTKLITAWYPRNGTDVAGWWTPPACRSWERNPPTTGADHITAGPQNITVNCRLFMSLLSSPGTTCHATWLHHLCLFSEAAPILAFFSVTLVQYQWSDSCRYCTETGWQDAVVLHALSHINQKFVHDTGHPEHLRKKRAKKHKFVCICFRFTFLIYSTCIPIRLVLEYSMDVFRLM